MFHKITCIRLLTEMEVRGGRESELGLRWRAGIRALNQVLGPRQVEKPVSLASPALASEFFATSTNSQ